MCSLRLSAEADTCGRKYCGKDFTDQVVTLCSSLIFRAGNLSKANISANPTITLSNNLTNNPFLSPFSYTRPQGRKYRRIGARYICIQRNFQTLSSRSLTRENFDSGREATVGVDFMAWVLRARGYKVKSFILRITLSDL